MAIAGGCLCGEVRYECTEESGGGHCHCIDCRKTSGTGHGSHMIVPEVGFRVTGTLRFFDKPADSGNIVSRGFCPACGGPVYSRNSGFPGLVFIRASTLDDPAVFAPAMTVYASRATPWDRVATDIPSFPEMPPSTD